MNYDQYIAEWNDKQVTKFGGQCVAGIAEFEAENNLPIVWGDAHTWINNPIMLSVYSWTNNNPSDSNQLPSRGDIVVWPLPNEHIAFFDHNLDSQQFMSFGQNSGGIEMHMQPHTWENVAGWYSLKQPVAPIVNPYSIEPITPKQIKLNKDTHLWNLGYDNFTAINTNPVADAIAGTVIIVRAVLHHNIGYDYYLTDPNVANGYNMLDCDDYLAPPPPPPAGPMVIPNSETYDLIVDVPGYLTSNQAINHTNEQVTIPADTYSVFNKRFDDADTTKLVAVNLTKTAGKPGAWINTEDNVEPVPEPAIPLETVTPATALEQPAFAGTYKEWPKAETYVAMADVPVIDLAGTKRVTMPKYSVTNISGTFLVNGIEYARPTSAANKNMWFGIAWTDTVTGLSNIELESEVYNSKTTIADRQATHTLQPIDKLALVASHLHNAYLSFMKLLGKIKNKGK